MNRIAFLLSALLPALFLTAAPAQDAITPDEVINLLTKKGHTVNLNEKSSLTTDPSEVWILDENSHLKVAGGGMGYIRTKDSYRDYHLVMEYKWGERTMAGRADRARDCGLLVHAFGEDGAYGGTWMSCIEAQLIEGGSGTFSFSAAKTTTARSPPPRSLRP